MEKMLSFTVFIVLLMVLMTAAGYNTTVGLVLGQLHLQQPEDATNLENSNFWSTIQFKIGGFITAEAIAIGLFGVQAVILPISAFIGISVLAAMVGDLISVIVQATSESALSGWVAFMLLIPLCVAYIIALWDWVRQY